MNNRYFEISETYISVVSSCFVKSNGTAVFTFVDGTTKAFKDPDKAEKWLSENGAKMKKRRWK